MSENLRRSGDDRVTDIHSGSTYNSLSLPVVGDGKFAYVDSSPLVRRSGDPRGLIIQRFVLCSWSTQETQITWGVEGINKASNMPSVAILLSVAGVGRPTAVRFYAKPNGPEPAKFAELTEGLSEGSRRKVLGIAKYYDRLMNDSLRVHPTGYPLGDNKIISDVIEAAHAEVDSVHSTE